MLMAAALQSLSLARSYGSSMCRNGLPDRQDVVCRVIVAVVVRAIVVVVPSVVLVAWRS